MSIKANKILFVIVVMQNKMQLSKKSTYIVKKPHFFYAEFSINFI